MIVHLKTVDLRPFLEADIGKGRVRGIEAGVVEGCCLLANEVVVSADLLTRFMADGLGSQQPPGAAGQGTRRFCAA